MRLSGDFLTPNGWIRGHAQLDGTHITSVQGVAVTETEVFACADDKWVPGFIDLHVHGGAGVDLMMGGDSLATIAAHQVQYGTTAILATTMTAPLAEIQQVLHSIQAYIQHGGAPGHAAVLGVHLEGPYINPSRLGAQPAVTREAVLQEIMQLHAISPIRVLTLAPECINDAELIRHLVHQGMRVQVGHSLGSYEDGVSALNNGASGFTHLFNAMTGLHHRKPGIVGAALAHAQYAELIPDLLHVHPGAIRVALRAIPHLYCVTDATAAAGMPDGTYMLGSQQVNKCLGGVRLEDGTLAGSTLTMIDALRNLCSIGLTVAEASQRLSSIPAQYLGLSDRGALQSGAVADLVALDQQLAIRTTIVRGVRYE